MTLSAIQGHFFCAAQKRRMSGGGMPEGEEFDLAGAIGARDEYGAQRFTIYLPNRRGNSTRDIIGNIEDYIQAAMYILAAINGGVTRLPPGQGIWFSQEDKNAMEEGSLRPEDIPTEETVLVYSVLTDPARFKAGIGDIRRFLHKFGRETEQGEVWAEFFGEALDGEEPSIHSRVFAIDRYDAQV